MYGCRAQGLAIKIGTRTAVLCVPTEFTNAELYVTVLPWPGPVLYSHGLGGAVRVRVPGRRLCRLACTAAASEKPAQVGESAPVFLKYRLTDRQHSLHFGRPEALLLNFCNAEPATRTGKPPQGRCSCSPGPGPGPATSHRDGSLSRARKRWAPRVCSSPVSVAKS
jgi:hypothetical protein